LTATNADKPVGSPKPLADDELDELCRILIGTDRERLREAIERLQERGQFIDYQSQTLADAMRLALARDPAFKESMGAMISQGVHSTVQRDSAAFGRALAPAMGPAIRNAVWMMLQGFVQSIETVVDQQLSWRSVRWRIEAMRTGRSFAEIAFLHTLLYRVEHVFLIHRDNGVQLLHATRPGVIAREPDLIAGMLTAIQDFLRDAFEAPQEDSATSFSINELNVTVENGNHAVVAAVVRGQPRADVRLQLREALDRIETAMAGPLADFDGETDPFEAVRPQLEACLTETARPAAANKKPKSPAVRWGLVTAALGLITWWVIAIVAGAHQRERLEGFLAELNAEPGYVITESTFSDDGIVLLGMRDPLARPFEEITDTHSVASLTTARFQPYHSLHTAFVAQRVRQTLQLPAGMEFDLIDRNLVLRGTANHAWLARTAAVAAAIDGIDSVDLSACEDADIIAYEATAAALHKLDPSVQDLANVSTGLRRKLAQLVNQLTIDASRIDRRVALHANLVWWSPEENRTAAQTSRGVIADLSRTMGVHIELGPYQSDDGVADATLRFTAKLR